MTLPPNRARERSLEGQTLLITGATRGIGLAIALRAAQDGAQLVLLGKTIEPHPHLPGTLGTASDAVRAVGGSALAIPCDVRDEAAIQRAVKQAVEHFGGIDILVNNASAIFLAGTEATSVKRFDLMHQVNTRGTFLCGQACIPYLKQSQNPHILTLSPPLDLRSEYFGPHLPYTLSKFGMSLCTLGWAAELRGAGIAVNSLWPRTVINTAAVRNLPGGDSIVERSRIPEIVADAAYEILTRTALAYSGHFVTDEDILREAGIHDFSNYSVVPDGELMGDLFLPAE
jgi:citronellol/citronellal dehydrogenase